MVRVRAVTAGLAVALAVGTPGPATAGAAAGDAKGPRFVAGAAGAGDAYFPYSGNGGYDVRHYDLALRYTPPTSPPTPEDDLHGRLRGTATLDLVATENLRSFNLDLRGLSARSVTVNGERVRFRQVADPDARKWELTVRPRPRLRAGTAAKVVVRYGGVTGRPTDIEGALYGWVTTRDGALVANEPDGAMTWFPVSDHPTDKATYSFEIRVPAGKVAVANGLPARDPVTRHGWTTWFWRAPDPQASYLATATIGDFRLLPTRRTASGVPVIDAVDKDVTGTARATTDAALAAEPDIIDFYESRFGRYPFVAAGAIVDDDSVDYALETQTRPVYSGSADEETVAHELAHQWFGDAVSPYRWRDIWLNEGWATYCQWLWTEHTGGRTAQQAFDDFMTAPRSAGYWALDISDPGPRHLFDAQVYDRGAATLHALRRKIGDADFFAAARAWVTRHADGTGTTAEFEHVVEDVSGQDLSTFFDIWLRRPEKPMAW